MVSPVDHLPSNNSSLAPWLLYRLHLLPLNVLFVFHVHWVIGGATVTFLPNLVFLSHPLISSINIIVLLLHEFPSLDISLHLCYSARLDQALFLNFLLMTLLSIIRSEVLLKAIHGALVVGRCWVWVIHFRVVHKLVISSNVLSSSHLVQKLLIYFWVRGEVRSCSLL